MEELLAKLGMSSVATVGISISAANIIEMIAIDKNRRMITKYACKELKYNNAIREIISYDDFAMSLQELFKEIGINPKNCNAVLNIPNVHFSFMSVPLVLPDDQVSGAIASEVEEMYLFKRHEPLISWNTVNVNKETDKRYVVYGAVQENTVQNIKDIFDELGCKLISIETSNSSMIKGIIYSRVLEEEFANNESSNILLISPSSYSIFCMQGKKLVDYFEEPFAIKSFSSDEVYIAIGSTAGSALENYPAKTLLVVSETNDVSAEILCHKLRFDGTMKFLDRNMYAETSFMEISAAVLPKYLPMISLEAVGAGAYTFESFPIKFNFLIDPDSEFSSIISLSILGQDYEMERQAVVNAGLIVAAAVLGLLGAVAGLIWAADRRINTDISIKSQAYTDAMSKVNATSVTGDVNNVFQTTKDVVDANDKEMAVFNALGTEIPNDIYITEFYSNSNGEIRINGTADSSESIYTFIKGLKNKDPKLKIVKLELNYTDDTGAQTVYNFTIENEHPESQGDNQNNNQQDNNQNGQGQNGQNGQNGQPQMPAPPNQANNSPQAPQQPQQPQAPQPANAPADLPAPAAP
jgi:hypothetical protein